MERLSSVNSMWRFGENFDNLCYTLLQEYFLPSLHSERKGLGSDIWEIFVEVKIGVVDASLFIFT